MFSDSVTNLGLDLKAGKLTMVSMGNILASRLIALAVLLLNLPAVATQTSRPDPAGTPTEVQIAIGILDVDGIDGAQQSFEANVFYTARWQDDRLAHDGNDLISRPLSEVWHPRLQLINQQKVWSTVSPVVDVTPSGEVHFIQRVWGSFSQPLLLKDFPFDSQDFEIKIAAAGYDSSQVLLEADTKISSGLADRFSLPDWQINNSRSGATEFMAISSDSVPTPAFVLQFSASRHVRYYILKIIIPLCLIAAMSWVVFWIDPSEAATQIGISTTAMLTLIAFRFAIDSSVPKVPYLTRMDLFILGATGLVFTTLIQAVLTSTLAKAGRASHARKIDIWCRLLFPITFCLFTAYAFATK